MIDKHYVYVVVRELSNSFVGQVFSTNRKAQKFIRNESNNQSWIVLKVELDEYDGLNEFHYLDNYGRF